jgi:hypothetical protein
MYFSIKNKKTRDIFNPIWSTNYRISKHKFFECCVYTYDYYHFEFQFNIALIGRDHAGIEFEIGILGRYLNFMIYDSRHWDKAKKTWVDG